MTSAECAGMIFVEGLNPQTQAIDASRDEVTLASLVDAAWVDLDRHLSVGSERQRLDDALEDMGRC